MHATACVRFLRRRGPAGLRDSAVRLLMLRFSDSARKASAQSPESVLQSLSPF